MFDTVVFGELREFAGKAAVLDVGEAADEELLTAAAVLGSAESCLAAARSHVLAELDVRGVTDREVGLSTGTWWARQAGVAVSAGASMVRVARALHDRLGEVDRALGVGRLSFEHARVLAQACNPRIAGSFAALQPELIDLAEVSFFEPWRAEVNGIADRLDQDGGHDPAGDEARNRLSVVPTVDGVTHVAGTLVGEGAEVARQAIDAVADELFRQHAADHDRDPDLAVPSRPTLRALAFVDLCRRGLATDLRSSAAPRADVTLVVRAEDPDRAVSPDGLRLADATVRTLLCDPDVTAVIVDGLGVPLDLGRRTRLATAGQRRALAVRDGGCVFPGCGVTPNWCDAHHLHAHRLGGRSDLANMALLCRRHHGVTHRKGWVMHADGLDGFTWTTPSGRTLRSHRHGRPFIAAEPP